MSYKRNFNLDDSFMIRYNIYKLEFLRQIYFLKYNTSHDNLNNEKVKEIQI